MMTDLELIAQLRTALSDYDEGAVWPLIERLEGRIETDNRAPLVEVQSIRRLKTKAGETFFARREGLNANMHLALVSLNALETSIKKRTTGPDGWPLA